MAIRNECPLCRGAAYKERGVYDDRYGYPGLFDILGCARCGHKYLSGNLPASLAGLYTRYYPRSNFDLEKYQPHKVSSALISWLNGGMSSAFRWVPKGIKVLDIGCGMGETLGYHSMRGCEVHGVDADSNVLRVGQKFGFNVRAGVFDPAHYEPNYFDYVTLDQVIEHIPDPVRALTEVASVIKPGGICVLSTPNANSLGARLFGVKWLHWHVPYHLHFFSSGSIEAAASKAGLHVESIRTITRSEWLLYQLIHLLMFPKQAEVSAFWKSASERTVFQTVVIKAGMLLRFTMMPQLATRIMDGLGIGDNFVVRLKKPDLSDDGKSGGRAALAKVAINEQREQL